MIDYQILRMLTALGAAQSSCIEAETLRAAAAVTGWAGAAADQDRQLTEQLAATFAQLQDGLGRIQNLLPAAVADAALLRSAQGV